ncbi:MAG: STAS domain-containing protein [Magnetococcus sp. YQC-5]
MIVTQESEGRITLRLPEEFNFKQHKLFRECYHRHSPRLLYTIDFQDVTSFDSSALGMLLLMRSYCGDAEARIRLINCNQRIRGILLTATFDHYFQIL